MEATMPLTDVKCRNAKVPLGKKQVKLADGGNMYLLVTPKSKYWRMDYCFNGKRKTLALGVYPGVGLKDARRKRDDARRLVEDNVDPVAAKKVVACNFTTFKKAALEWHKKKSNIISEPYAEKIMTRMEQYIFPTIGDMPIGEIKSSVVLAMLETIEDMGFIETAYRIKSICSQVFRYAIVKYEEEIEFDPTSNLRGALTPRRSKPMATIIDPKEIGALLRAINGYTGTFVVLCALRVAPYLFVRPGELRHAEWSNVDLDAGVWSIPAEQMKMNDPHIVYLTPQVVAVLRKLYAYTGHGKYLFPSIRSDARPMSENTINGALRRLGYEKEEICGHGFRAMASTSLHEAGWSDDEVERQLAHLERNQVKGKYDYAKHLPQRKKMMQDLADYLDKLRDTL